MDVPITIGVTLALLLSVAQTLQHAREAYFDSAIMLVLFLLAGRYLDQRMRRKTRDVASNLAAIKAETAIKLGAGGEAVETPIAAIAPAIWCWRAPATASPSTAWSRTGAPRSTRAW